MSEQVPKALKLKVAQRAKYCCEYCLVPEAFLATTFHADHIRSLKHDGQTSMNNLAYACPHCNQNKGSDIATFVGDSDDEVVRFFNPRKDNWHEHFETLHGIIFPKTIIGKATLNILDFNQPDRLIFRQALSNIGVYPPFLNKTI
jgi:hypothetical protein